MGKLQLTYAVETCGCDAGTLAAEGADLLATHEDIESVTSTASASMDEPWTLIGINPATQEQWHEHVEAPSAAEAAALATETGLVAAVLRGHVKPEAGEEPEAVETERD